MRGYAAVGLVNPKFGANIGGAMRAAHCYDARCVFIEGGRDTPYTGRGDTPLAWRHIPVIRGPRLSDLLPVGCEAVAVDLVEGAVDLRSFTHPERAVYVFGPEDGSLREEHLSLCRHRIMIPTKNCMNLAATVNVVLYDRLAKNG